MRKAIAAAYRLAVLFSVTALAQTPVEVQPVKELKPTWQPGNMRLRALCEGETIFRQGRRKRTDYRFLHGAL